jgi:hypothetical protein
MSALSFYEFQCLEPEDKCFPDGCDGVESGVESSATNDSPPKVLSVEAIVGLAVAGVAVLALASFLLHRSLKRDGSNGKAVSGPETEREGEVA